MYQSQGPLYNFSINGIQAMSNAWAYHQEGDDRFLIFASVIAPANILKGIRGTLDSYYDCPASLYPLRINENQDTSKQHHNVPHIHTRLMRQCHRVMAPVKDLAPAQSNLIVWARQPDRESPFRTSYAMARTPEELPAMYLQHLLHNTDVMALPHWAETIYDYALSEELIEPITSHNVTGCVIHKQYQKVMDFISEQLRAGNLPIEPPENKQHHL